MSDKDNVKSICGGKLKGTNRRDRDVDPRLQYSGDPRLHSIVHVRSWIQVQELVRLKIGRIVIPEIKFNYVTILVWTGG